jgi:osmotically-inducible protein OsmY
MHQTQITITNPDGFSRCEERSQTPSPQKSLSRMQKTDTAAKNSIYHTLWKDDVLRAIEYDQIDVHVKNGTIHLTGHIVNTSSQARIMNAIRTVAGTLVIHNNLVLDEKLILEAATSLGTLERTYDCKFFTGASHGILSLNGVVSNEEIKMLAEKCAASNPNVRGVINNVLVSGSQLVPQDQPFLQPVIGETIYFLDGVSGVVKQVIINPNNRRVTAMIIQGGFKELQPLTNGTARPYDQRIAISMDKVRYLTKASGFLYIRSNERNQYEDFDPASFNKPNLDWVPPYPYCPDDVLFPVDYQTDDVQIEYGPRQFPSLEILEVEGASFKEQFLANDRLGG